MSLLGDGAPVSSLFSAVISSSSFFVGECTWSSTCFLFRGIWSSPVLFFVDSSSSMLVARVVCSTSSSMVDRSRLCYPKLMTVRGARHYYLVVFFCRHVSYCSKFDHDRYSCIVGNRLFVSLLGAGEFSSLLSFIDRFRPLLLCSGPLILFLVSITVACCGLPML